MKRRLISKSDLEYLYFTQLLSHKTIAAKVGMSEPTLRARFREYGFVPRARGTWAIKHQKYPFTGSEQEKAYMMGFRIGDINVYMPSANANIIVARTNTTQKDQLEVIQSLFGKYGGVTISSGRVKSINCFLDRSFTFLLVEKPYHVEEWIDNSLKNCLAFIAGYIDAEGNFILNQGRARFTVSSYDTAILHWMHEKLLLLGYRSKLTLLANKGEENYNKTYRWNGDLWRLNINEANSLFDFCNVLLPYMRHQKRISDVKICLQNIKERRMNGTIRSK